MGVMVALRQITDADAHDAAKILRRVAADHPLTEPDAARLADALDPQPPTLREQVAREITRHVNAAYPDEIADAVLAVVADWLAAQPLVYWGSQTWGATQRDHDVRLLRGASDA